MQASWFMVWHIKKLEIVLERSAIGIVQYMLKHYLPVSGR